MGCGKAVHAHADLFAVLARHIERAHPETLIDLREELEGAEAVVRTPTGWPGVNPDADLDQLFGVVEDPQTGYTKITMPEPA